MRRLLPWLLPLLLAGCASSSRVSPTLFHPSYTSARDGFLRYRIPLGWFDASADPQATGHTVLLIRNDYRATIAVDEVRLDNPALEQLRTRGLAPVASLLSSLNGWKDGRSLIDAPKAIDLGRGETWRYALAVNGSEDRLEVTLLNAGGRVYTVNVLLSDGTGGSNGLFGTVQEGFIKTLQW